MVPIPTENIWEMRGQPSPMQIALSEIRKGDFFFPGDDIP
jgi:hypothetical protein